MGLRLLDTRPEGFSNETHCFACEQPFKADSLMTGYGTKSDGKRYCYACCGGDDADYMKKHGKIVLYLTQSAEIDQMAMGLDKPKKWFVTNWPGTLKFKTYAPPRPFNHPFTRRAVIAYFRGPDGKDWSARCIGEHTEIAHCRRLKT